MRDIRQMGNRLNKKAEGGFLIGLLVIGFILYLLFITFMQPMIAERDKICEEKEITEQCTSMSIGCAEKCESLGIEYFRYDDGGFGSEECWCKEGGETRQIY